MAISITRYVDVISGVAGGNQVPQRQLIARLFTDNPLVPPASFLQFDSASEVGSYFGTTSQEYLRAVFYFSFVSKSLRSPQRISYARWVDADTPPMIFGYVDTANPQSVSDYTSISSGVLNMTIGGVTNNFTGIDFTTAVTLADVATILQTKIQTAVGTQWTAATVTYDAVRGAFIFTGGDAVAAEISVATGSLAILLKWFPAATMINGALTTGAIWSDGALEETITDSLTASSNASDNFGTFAFVPTLTLDQVIEAATWNDAQNVKYMYLVPVESTDVATWSSPSTGVGSIGGVGLTLLSGVSDEYPEMLPMMIEAATDYESVNAVQNYMFQQSSLLTPSVTSDSTANTMDAARVNYYGQTQSAGQFLSFYQRGVLMGIATDPLDMNTYANEQWLKNAATSAIMNLLLALPTVSANAQGRSQLIATLQSVINQALFNGTISVGKTLTNTQIVAITQITGDANAYYQVQTSGYWVNCVIVPLETDPVTYEAQYTLVYAKNDAIRKVQGTHVLI